MNIKKFFEITDGIDSTWRDNIKIFIIVVVFLAAAFAFAGTVAWLLRQ